MSDFEDLLRRSLGDRAASVRTAPDERDVHRRIRQAERSAQRTHRAVLVGALVVLAGSAGGVLGAAASRPAGVPLLQASDGPSGSSTSLWSALGATAPTHEAMPAPDASPRAPHVAAPLVRRSSFGDLTVDWTLTRLAHPVEVVPGGGLAPTCTSAGVVSLTVGAGGPLASGAGTVGMPSLQPEGLAVVSSGTFGSASASGSPGRPSGWWAVLEAGTSATDVAVQLPTGAVVREPLTGGVAVVAGLGAPAGFTSGVTYGSAVAEGSSRTLGSLEFVFGGGIAAVGEATAGGDQSLAACPASSVLSGRSAHESSGGPPAALVAAGDVVASYVQAYDLDPLLGLTWNFAAVDLPSPLGCPNGSLAASSATPADGLGAPAVEVEAVDFIGPSTAVVIYRRGAGGLLETGTAELVDGAWKVGGSEYCADMQASGSAAAPASP